jgi:DNA-directed RNA polymerase specialized sigma24 family protein
VDRLAPRQRQVVQLKVFGELTHVETAHVMQLAPGSVKAHLHQAIANLRVILAEEETEDAT